MATRRQLFQEFVILGPKLQRNNGVLEAIHALYFLPENFKLIFTGRDPVDQSFYKEVATLVERDDLGRRVLFFSDERSARVTIADKGVSTGKKVVSGENAESLASAILNVAFGRNL